MSIKTSIKRLRTCIAVLCLAAAASATPAGKALQIYFSSTSWDGMKASAIRETEGQLDALKSDLKLSQDRFTGWKQTSRHQQNDYVLITHFHMDHVGGAPQLAARIPIGTFIDHGENRESTDKDTVEVWQAYQKLLSTGKYQHLTVKPGDSLPIRGIQATIVSADGAVIDQPVIDKPLAGAGEPNPGCRNAEKYPADQTENLRSVGTDYFRQLRFSTLAT
jgi:beta-lactamase superfamily II metal-dependent hydrolase